VSTINDINTDIKLAVRRAKEIELNTARIETQLAEQEDLLGTTYTDLIQSNIGKIKITESILEVCLDELASLQKDHDHYMFWVNSFGNQGIKSVLLDSVTPYLNQRANHYLSKLADSSIEVIFNTQTQLKGGEKRDKFSVDVSNKNGDAEYKGNSGGEKRRVDIAISMALQDLVSSRSNKSLDLVVYDEVYEGLDAVGCEAVIELLREKAKVFGTVIVITHNESLKQLFNRHITIKKEGGKTTVYEE
jgi:DNA repair exonuclease SbcCD ATPase subunit